MELILKPFHKNLFPIGGFLIRGEKIIDWLKEIQYLNLALADTALYAVPGPVPDSVWGCFILPPADFNYKETGKNEVCQQVHRNLFIPAYSVLTPVVTAEEMTKLFRGGIHIFHPEFGAAELQPFNFDPHIKKPVQKSFYITRPAAPAFVPAHINSFRVEGGTADETLQEMEEHMFPKKEQMKDKPLNAAEKLKLAFYKMLYTGKKESGSEDTGKTGFWRSVEFLFGKNPSGESGLSARMQKDFEALEQRNKKELDKLLDLLKKDPAAALKYAIPLNETGTNRGRNDGSFKMSVRWFDWSFLSKPQAPGSGGSIDLGDHFFELQKQYQATAEELIRQRDFQKAAFVYMKLLKNNLRAAQVLEEGKLYREAATVYLKFCNNKEKAAQCYESGNMISEAIALYKELEQNEKVGDLYISLNKKPEADRYYKKVADLYQSKNQFVKASLIYKNKIQDTGACMDILLEGWKTNTDGFNCLNNYFSHITDVKLLGPAIRDLYQNTVTAQNTVDFLRATRIEYSRQNEWAGLIKDLAYELVSAQAGSNPAVVNELKAFNPADKQLSRDTTSFININYKKK